MSDDLTPVDPVEDVTPEDAVVDAPAAPKGKLTLKRGGAVTDICFEFSVPATVGRFDPAVGPIDIDLGTIDESSYISRKHARITCEEGVWKVADLGSSNGTFVLGDDFERVDAAEIADGAELAFGNARFIFSVAEGTL